MRVLFSFRAARPAQAGINVGRERYPILESQMRGGAMALLNDLLGIGTAWNEKTGWTIFDAPQSSSKPQEVKVTVEVKHDSPAGSEWPDDEETLKRIFGED